MDRFSIRVGYALIGLSLDVWRDVCIHVSNGFIESIERGGSCSSDSIGGLSFIALPQPGNAHVHSADHSFPEYGINLDLRDLVAPPHGIKHKLLESTPIAELISGIREFYMLSWLSGLGLIIDFREGGGLGCKLAVNARSNLPPGLEVTILGRPGPEWPEGCEGLGVSSPLDYDIGLLRDLSNKFKPSMAHVAETTENRLRGDLERALEAKLDAIVHGTHLSREDLVVLKERNIGLIMCPRSNLWHNTGTPPIAEALRIGVLLALGTDNASWIPPDIWGEAQQALLLARSQGLKEEWAAKKIIESILINPYLITRKEPPVIEEGKKAKMIIYNIEGTGIPKAREIYHAIVKRINLSKIAIRIDNSKISTIKA
ncbi:MAG: amidohydrolase family protein [Acidilobaceae archaeon]